MTRIDKILELQNNLDFVLEKMQELKVDIDELTLCISGERFISTKTSESVIAKLQDMNELNRKCMDLCESLEEIEVVEFIPQIKEKITETIKKIEEEGKLSAYKKFLYVSSDDEEALVILKEKQQELLVVLKNYVEGMEEQLKPYALFVEALSENDSAKQLEKIMELTPVFGSVLVAKAFIEKKLYLLDEEEVDSLMKEDIIEETGSIIEEQDQNQQEEMIVEEETKNESSENQLHIELGNKGLFITEIVKDMKFVADISQAESKKFGVKSFINEMSARNKAANIIALKTIARYNSCTSELISMLSDLENDEVNYAIDYLMTKGYVRRYGIDGVGVFFCTSPKAEKAFSSKDSRTFLQLKGHANNSGEAVEDAIYPVLTRLAYSQLFQNYIELLGCETANLSDMLWTECCGLKIARTTDKKLFSFVGAFWNEANEIEEFLDNISEDYIDEVENIVIAGLNKDIAYNQATLLVERLGIAIEKAYCYALLDDELFDYINRDKCMLSDILPADELIMQEEQEETEELEIIESTQETEKEETIILPEEIQNKNEVEISVHEEPVVSEVDAISEQTVGNEINDVAYTEPSFECDVEAVKENTYKMIVADKIYCATTYLRSIMEQAPLFGEMYDKLAYAVNAPAMRCSYNSQAIFTMYADCDDLFSQYLMVSATLRNFFMNHVSYDYTMKALHTSIKELKVISDNTALANAIYSLVLFKENVHKGINFYADYRVMDKVALERSMKSLSVEAESYYRSYVMGYVKENTSHKRFIETRKLIFSQSGYFAECLKAIVDQEYSMADIVAEFLQDKFIKSECTIDISNIDIKKLNVFIDEYWDKAGESMRVARRTSDLMSSLRNNLLNAIEKILKVMCDWVNLVEESGQLASDEGSLRYKEVRKELIDNLTEAKEETLQVRHKMQLADMAGAYVLEKTLEELIARLDGSYSEKQHKYFYVDFLRGKNVLLNDDYLPDMKGKFSDFRELSLANRILVHSEEYLMTFEEKLEDIFNNYGDDYGTAELIIGYLDDMGETSFAYNYDVKGSQEIAEQDAERKFNEFVENLELAQSYGQIEESKESKKEKIHKIASEWFEYAKQTKNYGFFNMVLEMYRTKIQEDAKVRGLALLQEVRQIKEKEKLDEKMKSKIGRIEEMIENQNYTVAEDLLSRIYDCESEEDAEIINTDYLKKFIDEYEMTYMSVADSSRKLSTVVSSKIRNKDDKGARRLIDNWMNNGQPLGELKLNMLLDALGFGGAKAKVQSKIGKIENYLVAIEDVSSGRRVSYKHPIASFGSKAREDGFRVVCLFGKYDADRLIEEFKSITGTKNTLVLLDYALPLPQRRELARKVKSELGDKVYAVLDRVLLMFLVNNYNVQFINQILMNVMMPFAYYQPYVWDSSKVMPPEMFMGRKEELEKIQSPTGVNIVYGGRQLGKSALLKMAKMNIDNDENKNRAILVEIKGLDYERAAKKIGHELYDAGILYEDIETSDWDELARAIKRRLQDTKLPHIPYLLLLLDEADTFIDSCECINYQPFDALKDIQSVGMDRFKFVIAGLHNIVRFKRDAALSKNSVLTHLTAITVTPFNVREARELLVEPLSYLGFRFPREKQALVSLILAETNYFPGLIQLYCANLLESMRKKDYAGYSVFDTPSYEISEVHIRKVLTDVNFRNQIREKFEITLKLDEDNLYYIVALVIAFLYHQNANAASECEGYSAEDIIDVSKEFSVKKIADLNEETVNGLLQELLELNILRQTVNNLYLFSRYSFFQMMGTQSEVESKLEDYMMGE